MKKWGGRRDVQKEEKKRNDGKEEETRIKRGVAKHRGQDGPMGLATLNAQNSRASDELVEKQT